MKPNSSIFLRCILGLVVCATVLAAGPGYDIQPVITPQGEAFFPIGWWYNVQRWYNIQTDWEEVETAFAQMAQGGANVVYITNGPNFNSYYHRNYLTRAAQNGLKVIFMIFRDDLVKIDDPVNGATQKALISATIDSDLQYSNLLGYSLGDELLDSQDNDDGYVNHTQQQWMMSTIKQKNPNVMVLQSFEATQPLHDASGGGNCIEGRVAISDTLAFGRYPIVNTMLEFYSPAMWSNLQSINEKVNCSCGLVSSRRGLCHVEQAIGNEFYFPGQTFRYLTYNEMRFKQWSGIVSNRQRGAFYFEFGSLDHISQTWYDFFYSTVTPVIQEQRQLQNAMETGWDMGTVITNGDAYLWSGLTVRQVGSLLVQDGLDYYLILTNNRETSNTVQVTFSNLPTVLLNRTASLISETNTGKDILTLLSGQNYGEFKFAVSMSKFDVDIYRFSGSILGDMNQDGVLTEDDYQLLYLALTQPSQYQVQFPNVDINIVGDMNGSGKLESTDLNKFWEILLDDECLSPLQSDLNHDCRVDFSDLIVLVSEWLE